MCLTDGLPVGPILSLASSLAVTLHSPYRGLPSRDSVPLPRSGSRLLRICLGPWDSLIEHSKALDFSRSSSDYAATGFHVASEYRQG